MSNDEQNDSVFNRFCENVSIPTAKYLTAKHNRKVRIMTWILIIIMAGLTVYQIYERSAYYCTEPITVVVTESNQDSSVMPAMVICPPGQFRASLALSRTHDDYQDFDGSVNSDLFNLEQHRDTFISYFRRTNISFTKLDVDTLLQELRSIYEDLNNGPAEEISKILDRLDIMSASLQDRFPNLASKLSTKEPIYKGKISLKAENSTSITDSNGYAKYRALNGQYDNCAQLELIRTFDEFSFPDWNRAIRWIMTCRIDSTFAADTVIRDLTRFANYSRFINLARPNLTDIVLDCKWYNGEFSASAQGCNLTSVWTPFGQCFRIAPLEGTNLSLSSPESKTRVDVLIDTLTAEFPDGLTTVFLYSENETEFATTNGGIPIKPALESNLMIEQMRQNIRAAKNCGTTYLRRFQSYSKDKCIWEKSIEPVEKECNCLYDRVPNYLQDAGEEIAMMQADASYNSSLNFCSMFDTFFCAPRALASDYDCPDDCEELQPEVSLVIYPLDHRNIFSRLPPRFDSTVTSNMKELSKYGGYNNAPGSEQLDILLSELFLKQMELISLFWWKNRTEYNEPFYMAWFQDWSSENGMNRLNDYFGFFNDTSPSYSPLPFDFDETLFDPTGEQYSFFKDLITSILEKYETSQKDWTYSYSKESMKPFYNSIIADLETAKSATDQFAELRLLVLNKFVEEYTKFYKCVTLPQDQETLPDCYATYMCRKDIGKDDFFEMDVSICQLSWELYSVETPFDSNKNAAKYHVPISIFDLEQALHFSNSQNVTITHFPPIHQLKLWIEKFLQSKSKIDGNFTVWQAPWGIYTKWFRKEIPIGGGFSIKSLAQALSTSANTSDIFEIGNNYRDGSAAREYLKKAHLDVLDAMKRLTEALKTIRGCYL
uniref:Uncharacterized protein n=1 Tax=Plectus sambesii TaxID=2011161 RepID=A0A914VVC5_9BILA